MISVVIPLYNKLHSIKRAIESVLNQKYRDYELIVIDDGSTDGSVQIVKQFTDNRIKLIQQNNHGVSSARNHGINESKGEYVAFLDADDIWLPTFLETVNNLSKKYPECSVFATSYQRCNDDGLIENIRIKGIPKETDFVLTNYFDVASVSDPPFCSISVMAKKDAIQSVGGFPEGIAQGEDLLTWARLAVKYKIAYCAIPQSVFYTGEQSRWDTPKRIPPDNDIVGNELEKMHKEHPEMVGLEQYISLWHKMRASMFLRIKGRTASARTEIRIARNWCPNKKLALYSVLTLFPYPFRKLFFHN